jgi:membrane protein DedA with SNARE-associated domain
MSNWEFLIPYLEHLSYEGIFTTLAFLGNFVPLSEEVLLLIVGYIVSLGYGNLWIVIIVSLILALFAFYPFLITTGYIFHSKLQNLITDVSILSHVIFFVVVGLFAIVLSIYLRKNFSHRT